jgi:hypothetical protein
MSTPLLHQSRKRTGFSWWYHSLIDWILQNPDKPVSEAAKYFNRSPSTIYAVTGSDLFKAELARRRKELTKAVDDEIVRKMSSVADKALGKLEEKLDGDDAFKLGPTTLMDIADRALNKLGYGVQPQAQAQGGGTVNVNIQVNADVLAQAREKARQVQADALARSKGPLIEGKAEKVDG